MCRRLIFSIVLLTASLSSARNLKAGYEKNEIGVSVKIQPGTNHEILYSLDYAISRRVGVTLDIGKDIKSCELSFHFRPLKKLDPYFGAGLSYYKDYLISYSANDTLYNNPMTSYENRWASLFVVGLDYYFVKSCAIGADNLIRIKKGSVHIDQFYTFKFCF